MATAKKVSKSKSVKSATPEGVAADDWEIARQAFRQAKGHVALYQFEPNGLLWWKAYRVFRSYGLPVHEEILQKFDEWAERLESASGAKQVAQAIEMSGSRGGAQAAARVHELERRRRVVTEVAFRLKLKRPDQKMTEIYEAAARELRIPSWRSVQKTYTEWVRQSREKAKKPGRST
jgi:hypothetical protein